MTPTAHSPSRTTAEMTIPGLANLTSIMALCASGKTAMGGAYRLPSDE